MAVTVRQLAAALRLITDLSADPPEPQLSILTRLLGVADAMIDQTAPDAPDAIKDEATIRFASYLYDVPSAGRGDSYANSWRNSGAAGLVSRWVERRAAVQAEAEAAGVAVDEDEVRKIVEEVLAEHPQGPGLNQSQVQALIDAGGFQDADAVNLAIGQAIAMEIQNRSQAIAAAIMNEIAARNNAIEAVRVPSATLGRIPNPALPAPAAGTRGHFLAQAADGETYVFSQISPVDVGEDTTARQQAAQALLAVAAAQKDATEAERDADRNRQLIGLLQEQAVDLHRVAGDPKRVTVLSDASMFIAAAPTTNVEGTANIEESSWPSNARVWIRLADGELRSNYFVRFHGDAAVDSENYDVPGGQWKAATQFSADGFTFWEAWPDAIGGDVESVELLTGLSDSLYSGELAPDSLPANVLDKIASIDRLNGLTVDLREGTQNTWAEATDAALTVAPNQSGVTGRTYHTGKVDSGFPSSGTRSLIARIPNGADVGDYRVLEKYDQNPGGQHHAHADNIIPANQWGEISASDNTYDYYLVTGLYFGSTTSVFSEIIVQKRSTTHVTEYLGDVSKAKGLPGGGGGGALVAASKATFNSTGWQGSSNGLGAFDATKEFGLMGTLNETFFLIRRYSNPSRANITQQNLNDGDGGVTLVSPLFSGGPTISIGLFNNRLYLRSSTAIAGAVRSNLGIFQ